MDIYVYYRVPLGNTSALQQQATAMQARLARHYKITLKLQRRAQANDGMHTWMEVYLNVPDDFESALSAAVIANQLEALIDGARHTEYFLDVAPCA